MLEFGTDLEPLEHSRLIVNSDAVSIRNQIGARIGIDENLTEAHPGSLRPGYEANLGHALLLCLQGQSEIANRNFLFHRQGEDGIAGAIQDTMPYFLGAVPADQAMKRQLLEATQRDLRRAANELQTAAQTADQQDVRVRAAVAEAYAAGLITQSVFPDRGSALAALQFAVTAESAPAPLDDELQARLRDLEIQRTQLRQQLRETSELRSMLLTQGREEGLYRDAVVTEADRLRSVEVLPPPAAEEAAQCPICGSNLAEADPTSSDLRRALTEVRTQLADLDPARPRLRDALGHVDDHLSSLRQQLRALEDAAGQLAGIGDPVLRTRTEERAFSRGRLDVLLQSLRPTDSSVVQQLRQRVAGLQAAIERLEAELNADDEREQTNSRLLSIGVDMARWAEQLQLEHSGGPVRLDLRRLTVVAETDSGPTVMGRTGSAANWIGYHLITHLGLHRYFVRHQRPVPQLLMLDQPTQAYYPSEIARQAGVPDSDDDRLAVRRMYELINSVVTELNPDLQVIVCDHANLNEDWFQQSVVENWRLGGQLVPNDWIERAKREDQAQQNQQGTA